MSRILHFVIPDEKGMICICKEISIVLFTHPLSLSSYLIISISRSILVQSSTAYTAIMALTFPPRELYYNGQSHPAPSGKTFQTINPATATPLADIQIASHKDIDAAIASGERAFPEWSQTPAIARARILHKAASLLRERNDEIARVETLDSGKAFTETSTVDVVTGADVLEYYANFIGGGGLNGGLISLSFVS